MNAMLRPAISLMNGLRFTGKFCLMLVVLFLAIAVLVVSLYQNLNASIHASQLEISGIAVVKPVLRAVQTVQQHRGLAAAVLGGNQDLSGAREAKAREVAQLFAAADAAMPTTLQRNQAWQSARGAWSRIENGGMQLDVSKSVAAHIDLIGQMLRFLGDVADEYGLSLDPEVGSYYLMDTSVFKLPAMLETLGQLRALGAGILAAKNLDPSQEIDLSVFLKDLERSGRDYSINLDKTARANPSVATALRSSAESLKGAFGRIDGVVRDDILTARFSVASQDYIKQATQTIDIGYQQIHETLLPTLIMLLDERIERLNSDLRVNIAVIAIVLFLCGYLAAGMYRGTIDNLGRLSETAGRIAAGDLTARISLPCKDELQQVAASFNRMAEAVNSTVRNVRTNADMVLDAARRTAQSSSHIATASNNQSSAASSMAAAVEETTVGIDHISRNASDAREISHQSGQLSVQGGKLVHTVVAEMQDIATAVSASARSVEDLGKRSDQISTIVGVIKEIADQTNLLALNAAIEAARAGEQGRGFAVVADEVRKLAERTATSTQEIGKMIGSIQSETRAAVDNMKLGVERVARGVELTGKAGESMSEIEQGAARVVDVVREISDALAEQSAASADIARNVEAIAQMAEENSAAVSDNHDTAEQLEKLARDLQNEVARFTVS
ncbi:MAG: methyl-accepting chemotaxis protein [Rhodocyclales bacterium]|nr:methyl-accepting chemotaxis protein [Rhodocyclales bacterium]